MGAMNKANGRQGTKHKPQYNRYRLYDRRNINKVAKLVRHLKRYEDEQAWRSLRKMVAKNSLYTKHIPVEMRAQL